MLKKTKKLVIKRRDVIVVIAILLIGFIGIISIKKVATRAVFKENADGYVILAANDLGMHCSQKDY